MNTQSTDWGVALLRVSLGTMYLAHSVVLKLFTYGLAGTAGYFVSIGLPGWLAYVTFAAEAVGGVLILIGFHSRWVALALTPALLGAVIWAHGANGWVFTAHQLGAAAVASAAGIIRTVTGGYELAFIGSGALCLIAAGLCLLILHRKRRQRLAAGTPKR